MSDESTVRCIGHRRVIDVTKESDKSRTIFERTAIKHSPFNGSETCYFGLQTIYAIGGSLGRAFSRALASAFSNHDGPWKTYQRAQLVDWMVRRREKPPEFQFFGSIFRLRFFGHYFLLIGKGDGSSASLATKPDWHGNPPHTQCASLSNSS